MLIVPGIQAILAVRPSIGIYAMNAQPPMLTVAILAAFSSCSASLAVMSWTVVGFDKMAICLCTLLQITGVTILIPGSARPMQSASTKGMPVSIAAIMASSP